MAENYSVEGLRQLSDVIGNNITNQFTWAIAMNTSNVFTSISEIINNQDPSAKNLADALMKLDATDRAIWSKYCELAAAAKNSVSTFVDAVIAAEEAAMIDVNEINENLDSITSTLADITFN